VGEGSSEQTEIRMRVEYKRRYEPHATYSDAKVIDENEQVVFEYKVLELPWKNNQRRISCILPAPGETREYLVQKMKPTAKRNYVYFLVLDTPGRDAILWHPGNYTHQILGCQLPGESFVDLNKDGLPDITNTTATLKILAALLPDKFKLTIR
jgi:hypothetical protein